MNEPNLESSLFENVIDERLLKIIVSTVNLIDEFIASYKGNDRKTDESYRENVAPRFRKMMEEWKKSYKGNNADSLHRAVANLITQYYLKTRNI